MFSKAALEFLAELSANNNRAWFDANKSRYVALVREPALDFIEAMDPVLRAFAPHFRADPRTVGGSLMRVYRDTRFARDKTPYKTNIGIQFRHELGKDVHAPSFYVHIANGESFLGVGCWRPESDPLGRIRERIAQKPEKWYAVCDDAGFSSRWMISGDCLKRPPRGYASDHPAIEEIKRKDFVALAPLSPADIMAPGLLHLAAERFAAAQPFMGFLCAALGVQY